MLHWRVESANSYSQGEIWLNKDVSLAKLSVNQVLLKARSHIGEAQKLYQVILRSVPDNLEAQQSLNALNNLEQTTTMQGPSQDAINQLIDLYNQKQLGAVVEQAQALTEQYPEAFVVWNILGAANKGLGRVQATFEAFKKVIELNPSYAAGFNNLGITLQEQGKLDEAIACYNKALSLKTDYAETYYNMGNAFQDQGKLDQAIASYNKALFLKPDYADAYNNMGNALKDHGKFDEAIASYEKTLSLKHDDIEACNNIGVALKDQGKIDEAIASYNKALSFKPDYAEAHSNLSYLIKYKSEDTQVALVGELIQRPDLKDDDRCNLHYTFAKMNEDLGDLEAAYDNYVAGGKLRQKLLSYSFKQDELKFGRIKNTAPKLKDFAFNKPTEAAKNTPIFVLGMPRSGTTLVEQIISSHSKVHGAGELPFLSSLGNSLSTGNQTINSDNVHQFRNAYLDELANVSSGAPFVTDKMPQNFLYVGLILKALPEAKVIHVKRDPAATCWSNFKHYFSLKGLGYSYDLKDTVGYFKLYQDLMDLWDQQGSDQIYHLNYDKLTIDQASETRKVIEYIGLDWEDTCLSPQENKRRVRTASQLQVREKVYTESSQAWRKFKPFLNGTLDEFGLSSELPLN